jgi:hypothetical protein
MLLASKSLILVSFVVLLFMSGPCLARGATQTHAHTHTIRISYYLWFRTKTFFMADSSPSSLPAFGRAHLNGMNGIMLFSLWSQLGASCRKSSCQVVLGIAQGYVSKQEHNPPPPLLKISRASSISIIFLSKENFSFTGNTVARCHMLVRSCQQTWP